MFVGISLTRLFWCSESHWPNWTRSVGVGVMVEIEAGWGGGSSRVSTPASRWAALVGLWAGPEAVLPLPCVGLPTTGQVHPLQALQGGYFAASVVLRGAFLLSLTSSSSGRFRPHGDASRPSHAMPHLIIGVSLLPLYCSSLQGGTASGLLPLLTLSSPVSPSPGCPASPQSSQNPHWFLSPPCPPSLRASALLSMSGGLD